MGQVWLAEHTLLGRKVAVKGLHPQFARNAGIRARFKQEAATLSMLQHPNIVSLYDYIETDAEAYLVLEYVEGTPLDEYISRKTGPIPTPQLKQLFAQILDGFIYAHAQHVIHRDIKPSNFLVTADGKVKVLDFGIAKILTDANQKLTKTGTNIGTVLYMSPEQVRGQALDARSDIYSLGVTLFQMATGQAPYPSDSAEFAVYEQIVNHPLPNAREIYPGVTAEIEALIARATAKSLEARFQSCVTFKEALLREKTQEAPVVPAAPTVAAPTPQAPPPQAVPQVQPSAPAPKKRDSFGGYSKAITIAGIVVLVVVLGLIGLKKVGAFGNENAQRDEMRSAMDSAERHSRNELNSIGTVEEFYSRIGHADWEGAYALTTDNPFGRDQYELQRYFGCSDCCEYQSGTVSHLGSIDVVKFSVRLKDCNDGRVDYVNLKFRLVNENGEWKIQKRM